MAYSHRVAGDTKIRLRDFDPDDVKGLKRDDASTMLTRLTEEMIELQELLYASAQKSVLIVLQGRDTSGKDGTIRHVTGPLNSQGCEVASFKVPTPEELSHDFLWRIHAQTPKRGHITVFNRSHYEDVLVARVHNLVDESVWRARFDHINNFERLLADSGTIILKFYLHVSKDEQKERLLKREQDATKFWKLSVGDWKEREHWDAYSEAYEDALNHCATSHAPWYVVPANKKWFRNLAVADAVVEALRPYKGEWMKKLEKSGERELAAIQEFRRTKG
ncbi:MAG: polyphosphate kinase 2 family protein [Acidobacteriota bacterium]|nr:polyphosphate kinase 2 family protein [Acidobacteriota bacterium]